MPRSSFSAGSLGEWAGAAVGCVAADPGGARSVTMAVADAATTAIVASRAAGMLPPRTDVINVATVGKRLP
ncbi:hypothetical protein GCM10023317_24190 [Actinopolymorpha pittospori]